MPDADLDLARERNTAETIPLNGRRRRPDACTEIDADCAITNAKVEADVASNGRSVRKGRKPKPELEAISQEKAEFVRYDPTIKERHIDERPRERLEKMGASALSVTELLAIQLRTGSAVQSALGVAGELLRIFGGMRGIAAATREELMRVNGIGDVKATEICAAVEMARRLAVLSADEKPCIRSPQDVSNLLMAEMRDLKKEHLRSLLLDRKNEHW